MRSKGSAAELERRRRRAVALVEQGEAPAVVAHILGVTPSSLHRWRRMARQDQGLAAKPVPGAKRRLTDAQLRELEDLLDQGAPAHGFPNELWTSARVAQVIRWHFGVTYHPDYVRRLLLRRLGWTSHKPQRRDRHLAVPLTRQTLQRGRPTYLHALFDAGAGQSDAGVRALWDLADAYHPRLDVTMRACRYPHRVAQWKALPAEAFAVYEEPGPYVDARPKEVRVAETTMVLKDEDAEQAVRTIVCREGVPGPKKDRWHPLYTTALLSPYEEVELFRTRQNHEQSYRVGVYDEFLDAVPCGYDKESPEPKRPRFQRGPLQMLGWLVALVYNGVADLADQLVGEFQGSHVRTLRRQFFNRPGTLYETPEALIVQVDRFEGQESLMPLVDAFNAAGYRLPWLEDRRVVVSLAPAGRVGNDCRGSLLTGGP